MQSNYQNIIDVFLDSIKYQGPKDKNTFSTTSLIGPPFKRLLGLKIGNKDFTFDEIKTAFLGSAFHKFAEEIFKGNKRYIVEERFSRETNVERTKISGQIDLYDKEQEILYDWKYTSIHILKNENRLFDHEAQANINKWLLESEGHIAKELVIAYVFKDYSLYKESKFQGITSPLYFKKLQIWSEQKLKNYIFGRIHYHLMNKNAEQCTDEERWAIPEKFAVTKSGAKRASKLFADYFEATEYAKNIPGKVNITKRPKNNFPACQYCQLRNHCLFYVKGNPNV